MPFLVDLEALVTPHMPPPVENLDRTDLDGASILEHSVMRTGLLPAPFLSSDQADVVDVSGLGAPSHQNSFVRHTIFSEQHTDEWKIALARNEVPDWKNLPQISNRKIGVAQYGDDLVRGFVAVYREILKDKAYLSSPASPIQKFCGVSTRIILRHTYICQKLIENSTHPDLLRDAVDWQVYIDKLWSGFDFQPRAAEIVPVEIEALDRYDVPYFTSRTDTAALFLEDGRILTDFFESSGEACLRARLEKLSPEDLERQIWLIQGAVAASAKEPQAIQRHNASEVVQSPCPEQWLELSEGIGRRLLSLAFPARGKVTWLGLDYVHEKMWRLAPLLPGALYGGVPGVALFLAYLAQATHKHEYEECARKAILRTECLLSAEDRLQNATLVGGFEGVGSYLYAITHLAYLWNDEALTNRAVEIARIIGCSVSRDQKIDLIAGTAGALMALIGLYEWQPSEVVYAAIERCVDHLLAAGEQTSSGIFWRTGEPEIFSGFAHGSSGIAFALLAAYRLTGNEALRHTALSGIQFQRLSFDIGSDGRLGFRETQSDEGKLQPFHKPTQGTDWCHGASGIGLGRLLTLDLLHDDVTRSELDACFKTVVREGFGRNHSLCHGDLGNLMFLTELKRSCGSPEITLRLQKRGTAVFQSIRRNGALCGTPDSTPVPGLMIGLAGIGMGMLWMADQGSAPLVLALEGPLARFKRKRPT